MYPFLYFQNYKISVYFVALSIVYCIGVQYFFARVRNKKLKTTIAADFLLVLMIFGFIGARLFYVLYQEPSFYFTNPKEILAVWKGGFVYYGGFLCAGFFGYLFLVFRKQNVLYWLDVAAPVAALSYGLGRIACFLNGCCYGSQTSIFLGVKFPALQGLRHPTQLYAVIYELTVWLILLSLERKSEYISKNKGTIFFLWLILHALGRLIMEHFRADPRGDLLMGFTVSTVISFCLLTWSSIWFLFFKPNKNN